MVCLEIFGLLSTAACIVGYVLSIEQIWKDVAFYCGLSGCILTMLIQWSILYFDRKKNFPPISVSSRLPSLTSEKYLSDNYGYKSYFITLSHGKTFVQEWNPTNNEEEEKENDNNNMTMVLVHGIFNHEHFAQSHFLETVLNKLKSNDNNSNINRIVSYHLYGRGNSDSPNIMHNISLFTTQISELLIKLNINNKIILCGISMGGGLVSKYANLFPNRISKLISIVPAGMPIPIPIEGKLAKLPLFGDLIMRLIGPSSLKDNLKHEYVDLKNKKALKAFEGQWKAVNDVIDDHRNVYIGSIISSIRHFPLGGLENDYMQLLNRKNEFNAKQQWMLIYAEDDAEIPIKHAERFKDKANVIIVEHCGHGDVIASYKLNDWFEQFWEFVHK